MIAGFWLSDRRSIVVVEHFLDVSTGMEKSILRDQISEQQNKGANV